MIDEVNDKLRVYDLGLEGYDLDIEELLELKGRSIEVYVEIEYWPEEDYFKYRPLIRRKKKGEWYRNAYRNILEKWPSDKIKKMGSNHMPKGFMSEIKTDDIPKARSIKNIDCINILKIEGIRKKRQKKIKKEKKFFAVKARFAEQVEGKTKGMQRFEERIVLVKAFDFEDAEKRAMKEFKEYEQTYLADNGYTIVRWKFEEAIELYDVGEEEIDPKGTEVFSKFRFRRMKPEYEWHPEYVDDED